MKDIKVIKSIGDWARTAPQYSFRTLQVLITSLKVILRTLLIRKIQIKLMRKKNWS
ncbi:MAG: hypothetical protein ACTSU2_10995 [Promethearchaeota archaeon]